MAEAERIPQWIDELNDPNPDVRREAARQLGAWGNSEGVPALLECLRRDDDPWVRATAASSLGHHQHPQMIEVLLAGLDDPASMVRQAAASVLAECVGTLPRAAKDSVLRALERCLQDGDPALRIKTALSLGLERVFEAVPLLIGRLENEADPEVRMALISALGWLRDGRAREVLSHCERSGDPGLRNAAREALSRLRY